MEGETQTTEEQQWTARDTARLILSGIRATPAATRRLGTRMREPRWWLTQLTDFAKERSRGPSVIVGNALTFGGMLVSLLFFHMPAAFAFVTGYVIGDAPMALSIVMAIKRWDGDRYASASAWSVRERMGEAWSKVFRDGMRHHSIARKTPVENLGVGRFGFIKPSDLREVDGKTVLAADAMVTNAGWRPSHYRIEHNQTGLRVVSRSMLRRVPVPVAHPGAASHTRLIPVASVANMTPILQRAWVKVRSPEWRAERFKDWRDEKSRVPSQVFGNGVTGTAVLLSWGLVDLSSAASLVSGMIVGQYPTFRSFFLAFGKGYGPERYFSPAAYAEKQRHKQTQPGQQPRTRRTQSRFRTLIGRYRVQQPTEKSME